MAMTITKILKKAIPTVRTSDDIVKAWEIEVLYKNDADGWTRSYDTREDVEYLNKKADAFTKEELIALMPSNMDVIFEAHWTAHNTPATEERVSDFNINDLG